MGHTGANDNRKKTRTRNKNALKTHKENISNTTRRLAKMTETMDRKRKSRSNRIRAKAKEMYVQITILFSEDLQKTYGFLELKTHLFWTSSKNNMF